MILEILIFTIVVIMQVAMAAYALLSSHKIDEKYEYPLGSQTETAVALENYAKIYRQVGVRVNAEISVPAYAFEEHIFVNREKMYRSDLFTTFFTIFQLELSRKEHDFARRLGLFQSIVFIFSFLALFVGVLSQENVLIGSYIIRFGIGLQSFLIFISIMGFVVYNKILKNSLWVARDLLDLDEVEFARAERLKEDLQLHVFEYPLVVFGRFMKFLFPF